MVHSTVAVGVWFVANDTDRYLYLMRNDVKYPYHWGLPGGKSQKNESLLDTIRRECVEEMGKMPAYTKLVPLEKYTSNNNYFFYHTFLCILGTEFIPVLNNEHIGYSWVNQGIIPKPLHPGLSTTINVKEIYQKIRTIRKLYLG